MYKIRAEITKGEAVRYISHLDYAGAIERAIRRAGLPVGYSEGFNPHMKLAFASALALGVTSAAEYMETEFIEAVSVADFLAKLRPQLPEGIAIVRAEQLTKKQPALMAFVDSADYEFTLPDACVAFNEAQMAVEKYNQADQVPYTRLSAKKGAKELELKQYCQSVTVNETHAKIVLYASIRITPSGSIKPAELLAALKEFGLPCDKNTISIHRKALYAQGKNPLDVEV